MRSRPAEMWAAAGSGPWGAAVRGNSALREALLRCFADEAALSSLLLDFVMPRSVGMSRLSMILFGVVGLSPMPSIWTFRRAPLGP
eukprot:5674748-Pyramimonas_sp.AAC.1